MTFDSGAFALRRERHYLAGDMAFTGGERPAVSCGGCEPVSQDAACVLTWLSVRVLKQLTDCRDT